MAGLRWSDVDLEAPMMAVSYTRLRFGANLIGETPKSAASRFTLSFADHVLAALRAARATQAETDWRLARDTGRPDTWW